MFWQVQKIGDFTPKELEHCLALMTPARRAQVEAIKHPARRTAALCAEWLAKKMLAEYTGIPLEEILLERTEKGKPFAQNCAAHFNLSHSGPFVACAVGDAPLGVDIEELATPDLRVAKRLCTPEEMVYLDLQKPDATLRFYRLWTAKEAYFKAIGTGITNLQSVCYFDLLPRLQRVETKEYILSVYQE